VIPAGLTIRAARPGDAAVVAALIHAGDEALGAEGDTTEADVRAFWLDLDLERDTRLVEDAGGRTVGYLELNMRGPLPFADGYVHPGVHGQGLGRALVRLGQELAADRGDRVRTAILAADTQAASLLRSEGFGILRSFYRMAIDLEGPPPEPSPPPGIVLRPFDPAEAEAFHAATEEAFVDHWEQHAEDYEHWRMRTIDADDYDPSLWLVAVDGEELAGTLRATAQRFGSGWVNSLGVRRPWRRRGVGAALLLASFGEFWRRDERRVALGVDAESETGATHLYESLGMRVVWQADIYEKEIR
jgi:mycothiol synthase